MKTWQEGVNLDLPEGARCSDHFAGLGPLLGHCGSRKDMYYSGFEEYVRTLAGGHIGLPRQQAAARIEPQKETT